MKRDDFVKRVEGVLDTLDCGFKFEKLPTPVYGGDVCYVCKCNSAVSFCGMNFDSALMVELYNHTRYGWSLEYDISYEIDDLNHPKWEICRRIKEMLDLPDKVIEHIVDCIYEIVYAKFNDMHKELGREIERRLPDVEFADRHFYPITQVGL